VLKSFAFPIHLGESPAALPLFFVSHAERRHSRTNNWGPDGEAELRRTSNGIAEDLPKHLPKQILIQQKRCRRRTPQANCATSKA